MRDPARTFRARVGAAAVLVVLGSALGCGYTDPPPPNVDAGSRADAGSDSGVVTAEGVCLDNDGDGVGGTGDCSALALTDCDDADPARAPGLPEKCDQIDNDCDGQIDEELPLVSHYIDGDNDGYGAGTPVESCSPQLPDRVTKAGDCNDGNDDIHPGATEQCNGLDDNCDLKIDDTFPTRGDACQTGLPGPCAPGSIQCVSGASRCVGLVQASAEVCDGADNDCDGSVDESFTNKGTTCSVGQGVCANSGSFVCTADQSATVCTAAPNSPNAPACDGADNDCDGAIDETELVMWWSVAPAFEPTDMAVAPFFFTATGCNGGQATTGSDQWGGYYAAYVRGGDLFAQKIEEDGHALSTTPVDLSSFTSNVEVSIAQAGPGMAAVAFYRSSSGSLQDLDLYAFGPGPTKWTLDGQSYKNLYRAPTGASLSNVRVVRGNGGRFVVLWRETTSSGSKIRMARYSLSGSGTAYTLAIQTAPRDLVTVTGSTGAFGAASSHATYGDLIDCPTGLAQIGVAHVVQGLSTSVKLDVFNEDGTATTSSWTVYSSSSSTAVPGEPDVAWASSSGAARWGVVHSLSWDFGASDRYERVNFWHSGQSGASAAFGPNHSGNALDSVRQPRITSRTSEFMVSTLAFNLVSTSTEPQVWAGRKTHNGATVSELQRMTTASGCSGTDCVNGVRRLARPLASSSGQYASPGVILMTGASGAVHSAIIGCN